MSHARTKKYLSARNTKVRHSSDLFRFITAVGEQAMEQLLKECIAVTREKHKCTITPEIIKLALDRVHYLSPFFPDAISIV